MALPIDHDIVQRAHQVVQMIVDLLQRRNHILTALIFRVDQNHRLASRNMHLLLMAAADVLIRRI